LSNLTFDQVASAPFNLKPVGSGPYRFDHLLVEDGQITGLVLAAWDQYYGKKPYVEQIVFRFYTDGASALQAYRDGAVQGISEITPDILEASLAEANLSIYTGRKPQLAMILFNLKNQDKTFLQEADVRRALLMGINRQRIIDQLLNGQAVLADGPILPGTWAYYDGLQTQDFDPEGAKTLLKNAGYILAADTDTVRKKDKVALNFTLIYPDDEVHKAIALAIQKDWANLNVQADLEAVPYDQLINNRLGPRAYDAALVDLNLSRTPDPDPYPFWDQAQAASGQNYTQWDSRVASEYLEQARIEVDLSERTRLYRNFQVVFDEDLPALPLYYPVYSYGVDKEVQGVRMGPLFDTSDRFDTILDWFFAVKRSTAAPTLTPEK
jgi:peptide/nickel transport system substrate-binding protein